MVGVKKNRIWGIHGPAKSPESAWHYHVEDMEVPDMSASSESREFKGISLLIRSP